MPFCACVYPYAYAYAYALVKARLKYFAFQIDPRPWLSLTWHKEHLHTYGLHVKQGQVKLSITIAVKVNFVTKYT